MTRVPSTSSIHDLALSMLPKLFSVLQTVNFELTQAYLDLIITYLSTMVLLARVEDRKAVLGLFNYAYELMHGKAYV